MAQDNRFVGINVTGSSASATIAGLLTNVDQRTISPSSGTANRLQFGLLGIIIIQVLMLTFKKLPRWNRWVRQFSYILKSGIGMRFGSLRVSYMQLLRMLLLQMTPGLQMQEHLFLIVYFLTQLQLLN
jgi:hypothetical protein